MKCKFVIKKWPHREKIDSDLIFYDPPYDGNLYCEIPSASGVQKTTALIVATSTPYLSEAIVWANKKGWRYRFAVVWDTVTSWYVPGRPLLRDNLFLFFGDFIYHGAEVEDGVFRKGGVTRNGRGEYHHAAKYSSVMSSVFKFPRSQMNKNHPHQKPIELLTAFIMATGADTVTDIFCGSGIVAEASRQCGVSSYIGFDSNAELIAEANKLIKSQSPAIVKNQPSLF